MTRVAIIGTINSYRAKFPGCEVIHVDKSARGIWDAEAGKCIPVDVVADMRALPFADASIDRVQAWHSLEHVNQSGGLYALQEWARVLKPGAVLDVKVPDMLIAARALVEAPKPKPAYYPFQAEWDFCRRAYGDQSEMVDADLNGHLWGYTPRSLAAALDAIGFEAGENLGPGPDGDEIHYEAVRR